MDSAGSIFCAGWGQEPSCFSICTRNTYWRLGCRVHLGGTCPLMVALNYFNFCLTGFRALPSTDLTESVAAVYSLFQATTTVLPLKKEIRKRTENHEIDSDSFSSSEMNFCLLLLLLCFLSFSPGYKEHIIKEWMLMGLSLNHMPQEKTEKR